MKKFIKIENIGQLYFDIVLFSSHYPILFTCLDKKKQLYICVCYHFNLDGQKWLITKTDETVIIKILTDRISLREAFLAYNDVQISVTLLNGKYSVVYNDSLDWDYAKSTSLPDEGEYMDVDEGEFDEEINYYAMQSIKKDIDKIIEKTPPSQYNFNNLQSHKESIYVQNSNITENISKIKIQKNVKFLYDSDCNVKKSVSIDFDKFLNNYNKTITNVA